jgi:hypothetical protein
MQPVSAVTFVGCAFFSSGAANAAKPNRVTMTNSIRPMLSPYTIVPLLGSPSAVLSNLHAKMERK